MLSGEAIILGVVCMDFLTFNVSFCAPAISLPAALTAAFVAFPCLTSLWAAGCKSQRRHLELCGPAFPRTSPGDTNFER